MSSLKLGLAALAIFGVAVACHESAPTGPTSSATNIGRPVSGGPARADGYSLVECPTNTSTSSSALIDSLGGLVSAGGVTISIPAGALLEPVTVTVTTPASNYLETDISVEGAEHFLFEVPVEVTFSYERCNRTNIDFSPIAAWYIDSETKALLELMPSVDNKVTRTVIFTTDHLSGYALAN